MVFDTELLNVENIRNLNPELSMHCSPAATSTWGVRTLET